MGFLTVLVYLFLSFFVGIFSIAAGAGMVNFNKLADYLNQHLLVDFSSAFTLVLIGLVIILLSLRYLQKIISGSRQNKSISFESKQGKVNITLMAIEDLLKKMLEAKEEISHTKIKVCLKKRIIQVKIKGYLNYEVNLVDFTSEIQTRVKEKLQILLGEDKRVQVNLQIRKISVPEGKGTKEDQTEAPFRHYE